MIEPAARLAQRAGGQHPPVAEPAVMQQCDLHVACQRPVLQAVVGDDDVALGVALPQEAGRGDAPPGYRDRHRCRASNQQRLIADLACRVVDANHSRLRRECTVAA
jgi:hypothetical protein